VATEGAIPDDGACANCGGPPDRLEEVLRVYVTVDEHGRVTGSQTMAGGELWCLSCRSLYPHAPAGDDAPGAAGEDGDPSTGR
jgi:hypothetical protein